VEDALGGRVEDHDPAIRVDRDDAVERGIDDGGGAAAVLLGAENFINVVAGGVVAPANAAILALGVIGVVFVNFCQIGKSLTPLYLYYTQDTQPTPETKAAAVEKQ